MSISSVDQKLLLKSLFDFGYFWNPANQNGLNVDLSNVEKLDVTQSIAKEAIASWQGFDANFDVLSISTHKRQVVADGIVGPVTLAMLNAKRCAMPDFAPPPNASFHYDNDDLQKAVESYQRYAEAGYIGGSGSWPKGCDPSNLNVHSVVAAINISNASGPQKLIIDQVLKYVEQTEAEIGQSVRHVLDGSFRNPQHNVQFENIPGSVIGYSYFPTPDTCNQTVQCRIDNSFNASLPVMAELLTHEYKGHSDGLQHTRGGIMNPSIGNPSTRSSWIGDISQNIKFRYFGGVPIPNPTIPARPNYGGSLFG